MAGPGGGVKALASAPRCDSGPRMTEKDKDKAKAERLAAALRDNLRRRKAQARDVGDSPGAVLGPHPGGDEQGGHRRR